MRPARAYHAAVIGCALAGAAPVLFATQTHGIALSSDSAAYLSAARNVMQGNGVNAFTGDPLVVLAPLYSLVLGVVSKALRADPLVIAPRLNALLCGLTIYAGGRIAFQLCLFPLTALAATAAILFSPTLVFVSTFAWSEALFIFLTVFALWASLWYLETHSVKVLALLAALIALACLTRYAGVPLLGWGVLVILGLSTVARGTKARHAIFLLSIGGLPLGVWVLRNYLVSETLFGGRPNTAVTLRQNLDLALDTVKLWFLPYTLATRAGAMVLTGAAVGIWIGATLKKNGAGIRTRLNKTASLLLLFVSYVVFLLYTATTTAIDPIGERLLAPVFVPLMLVTFAIMEVGVPAWWTMLSPRVVSIGAALVVLIWLVSRAEQTVEFAAHVRSDGQQFTSQRWRASPTAAYVRAGQLPPDCLLMSNQPSAMYLLTNLVAKASAVRGRYNSPDIVNADVEQLRGSFPSADETCLVWFEGVGVGVYFRPEELARIAAVDIRAQFSDGAIYLLTRK